MDVKQTIMKSICLWQGMVPCTFPTKVMLWSAVTLDGYSKFGIDDIIFQR
jgi:hypothetical protein